MVAVTGIILAGGKARRMGGVNKGLVPFRGKPLIAHVLERFMPQVDSLIINANQDIDRYSRWGYPVISDSIPDFAGPLAGFLAGMTAASTPLLATVPCDTPFLPSNLLQQLSLALDSGDFELATVRTGQHLQPVFCLCKTSIRPSLSAFLQEGEHKVESWFERLRMVAVDFPDQSEAFANFNTLRELEAAA